MKKFAQLALTLLNIVCAALVIGLALPPIVPTHFGITGVADAWGSRWTYLIFGALPFLIEALYQYSLTHAKKRPERNLPIERRVTLIVEFVFMGINWMFLYVLKTGTIELNPRLLTLLTALAMGGMLLSIYNVMGKVQRNRIMGVRTPSTLASDYVWNKTNRASSYVGFITGLTLIVFGLLNYRFSLVSEEASIIVLLAITMLGSAIIPLGLAWFYGRKRANQ